jgi:hypothetical protein
MTPWGENYKKKLMGFFNGDFFGDNQALSPSL